jgi:hypothetical protein
MLEVGVDGDGRPPTASRNRRCATVAGGREGKGGLIPCWRAKLDSCVIIRI